MGPSYKKKEIDGRRNVIKMLTDKEEQMRAKRAVQRIARNAQKKEAATAVRDNERIAALAVNERFVRIFAAAGAAILPFLAEKDR